MRAPLAPIGNADLSWHIETTCPGDWAVRMTQLGGGFFHSPLGLQLNVPSGAAVFATLYRRDRVIGLATGVWNQCRLSGRPRHFYAPTLPLVEDASLRIAALVSLRAHLAQNGAAEVLLDSFDGWEVEPPLAVSASRREYVVSLGGVPEQVEARFADTHRRHLDRGRREGWSLRKPVNEDAITALREVQSHVAHRRELRGDGFDPRAPSLQLLRGTGTDLHAFWGLQTFAAWHDDSLLAAVLIGWANQRAYYILGGSTPEGYRRSAAVWLHWRAMGELAAQGCSVYNLGGTPASATRPEAAAHGLFRFKSGFGAAGVGCRGACWSLRPGHMRAHQVVRWLVAALQRSPLVAPAPLARAGVSWLGCLDR
jgi:hypothetical protein